MATGNQYNSHNNE